MQKIDKNKGITLIALVITIIVLLILAGVSISMLTGDNSLLNQAANVKETTGIAQIEESINLAVIGALGTSKGSTITKSNLVSELNSYFGEDGYTISGDESSGWTVTVDDVTKVISNSGDVREQSELEKIIGTTVAENTTVTDSNGDSVVIPAGFNISSESATLITKGVVIEDSDDNQYVWIPVFEISSERDWGVDYSDVTDSTDYTNIESALKTYTVTYARSSYYEDVWYGNEDYGLYGYYDGDTLVYYSNGNMTEDEYEELYQSMLSSIYTNGGFYIGRYEMGIDVVERTSEAESIARTSMSEYASTSTNSTNTAPSIGSMTSPISKANAVAYTYITQSQAQMLAESLNYSSVTSSLMFGVQWDAVCVFIENYDKNNSASTASQWLSSNNYSNLWGNYSNSTFEMTRGFYNIYSSGFTGWTAASEKTSTSEIWLCTTGASDQNSSLNIYDFAGNLYEWTLERYSRAASPCVIRGGVCANSYYYASGRTVSYTYYYGYGNSARASIWL